jgi:hypothetical protein
MLVEALHKARPHASLSNINLCIDAGVWRSWLARTAGVRTASGSLQGNLLLKTCFLRRSCGVAERDREVRAASMQFL